MTKTMSSSCGPEDRNGSLSGLDTISRRDSFDKSSLSSHMQSALLLTRRVEPTVSCRVRLTSANRTAAATNGSGLVPARCYKKPASSLAVGPHKLQRASRYERHRIQIPGLTLKVRVKHRELFAGSESVVLRGFWRCSWCHFVWGGCWGYCLIPMPATRAPIFGIDEDSVVRRK
jgi:hypothetical protein